MISNRVRRGLGLFYRLARICGFCTGPEIVYTTRDLSFYVKFSVFSESPFSLGKLLVEPPQESRWRSGPDLGYLEKSSSTEIASARGWTQKGPSTRNSSDVHSCVLTKVLPSICVDPESALGMSIGLPATSERFPSSKAAGPHENSTFGQPFLAGFQLISIKFNYETQLLTKYLTATKFKFS
jgi:hypothetical protein